MIPSRDNTEYKTGPLNYLQIHARITQQINGMYGIQNYSVSLMLPNKATRTLATASFE